MRKRDYIFKRIGAALIDLFLFALIIKIVEPFLFYEHSRNPANTDNNGSFFFSILFGISFPGYSHE
jgi:hypothetical protein